MSSRRDRLAPLAALAALSAGLLYAMAACSNDGAAPPPGAGAGEAGATDGPPGALEAGFSSDASFPDALAGEGGANRATGCAGGAGLQAGSPWPMHGHCPAHQGRTTITGPTTMPSLKWSAPALMEATVGQAAIAADGTIYAANFGQLLALHPDGSSAWTFPLPMGLMNIVSDPAIGADGTIYMGAVGALFAVLPSGKPKWSLTLPGTGKTAGWATAPLLDASGTLYVVASDGTLYAIDPTGKPAWTLRTAEARAIPLSVALAEGGLLVLSDGTSLYAVHTSGMPAWKRAIVTAGSTSVLQEPVIGTDGRIYALVKGQTALLYALDASGNTDWTFPFPSGAAADPVFASDGTVYVAGRDAKLYAIDSGGHSRWTLPIPIPTGNALAVGGDGTLYVPTQTSLVAISSAGTLLWGYPLPAGRVVSSLAIAANGWLIATGNQPFALGD